mmetsp:Transcript_42598/g.102705  ORF Transcript_42598/g.102705 Transcript_42598/m.102705 type:complete len:88 (-) Transcript_42598:1106-1369(-)
MDKHERKRNEELLECVATWYYLLQVVLATNYFHVATYDDDHHHPERYVSTVCMGTSKDVKQVSNKEVVPTIDPLPTRSTDPIDRSID